ncbi:hypothetical protein SERLA73DRAFT_99542 [Serpula lacrymans var. lacrymans S7.3]|uniref:MMS19 nucleotide excision repair protein n=1 Tax=Serpula lacrymans var. lacrymans (strain S7.3) TaxID=936435 RepID=F8QHG6_SERL3|nr:hypothetical protein SERLA73DRAFT_99542 [Serpula lacrymans var. lacrymans S7.3]
MVSEKDQEVEEVVSGISNGQIALLDIVKALGEYLTSEEDSLRTKGVNFLSSVVGTYPPDKLNRQAVRVLVAFYRSKLEDTETITPALKGLSFLVKSPACNSTDALDILSSIFAHVKMNVLVQSTRFFVFSVVDTLLANHRDALKDMGKPFFSGYIGLAEGEKDPRNLLIAFTIARVLLTEFDLHGQEEDFFNITFCYFPITFRPPPNDPYSISTDDLRRALRGCLSATRTFGPLGIPLFLEKLTAGSPTTKRDTMQTMSYCLPSYGADVARSWALKMWSSLKLEIFQPTDPLTEKEALEALQAVIRVIYGNDVDGDGEGESESIQGLAKQICEECLRILREPEKSQAKPAIKVICSFIVTTPTVSRYTVSRTLTHLVNLFNNPDERSNRPAVTALLSDVLAAAQDSKKTASASNFEINTPLMSSKDGLLAVLSVALKTPASCRPALCGLKNMVLLDLLTDEELGFVVLNANDLLQSDSNDDDTLDLLSTISAIASHHVKEQTLPLLFSSLPDQAPPRAANAERVKNWRTLSALTKLCSQQELFEILVIRLSTKLDLICTSQVTPKEGDADQETVTAYAHSILTAIVNTLTVKVNGQHADVAKYVDRLLPRIYNLFVYAALVNAETSFMSDPRVIRVAARVISLIVETLTPQRQERFASAVFSAYLTGDVKAVAEGHQPIPAVPKFEPFSPEANELQRNTVFLLSAGITPLRKEVPIPVPDLSAFLDKLIAWNISSSTLLQKEAAWHIVSSIVNKRSEDVSPFLDSQLNQHWSVAIENREIPSDLRRHTLISWTWISKALLIRNHPRVDNFIDCLFSLFVDEAINWDAGRAIGELCGGDQLLSKRNHCVVRILYAQKFFVRILPRLIESAKASEASPSQVASLVAITYLLKSVPKEVYIGELSSLMPLLIRCLDLPDPDVRSNVINCLDAVLEGTSKDVEAVSEYASTIVSTVLKNCMRDQMPDFKVRVAALRYLGRLPEVVRYDILHPYKPTVLKELAKVLDDPKRSVRKEAVDARTSWFKYNG